MCLGKRLIAQVVFDVLAQCFTLSCCAAYAGNVYVCQLRLWQVFASLAELMRTDQVGMAVHQYPFDLIE